MDIWTIIIYVIGVIFNIAVVAKFRAKAIEKGKSFLSSGRFALIAVYLLCLGEMLVTGKFSALQDPASFTRLLQDAWILAGATIGTHTGGKTLLAK